jgi:hypothetical protein
MLLIDLIEREIDKIIKDFNTDPDIFLTEEDVRCHLVSRFLKHKQFSQLSATADDTQSIPIHTEVRWYGKNKNLKYRSDIVCFDTSSLRTKKELGLPSKGYVFDTFNAVIELKLRRMNNRSDKKYISMIDEDFSKLKTLIREVEDVKNARYYLLCFDKKKDISSYLTKYRGDQRIDFRYIFKQS